MMNKNTTIKSIKNMHSRKEGTIDSRIRICIECGSTIVFMEKYGITCKDCESTKHFDGTPLLLVS